MDLKKERNQAEEAIKLLGEYRNISSTIPFRLEVSSCVNVDEHTLSLIKNHLKEAEELINNLYISNENRLKVINDFCGHKNIKKDYIGHGHKDTLYHYICEDCGCLVESVWE